MGEFASSFFRLMFCAIFVLGLSWLPDMRGIGRLSVFFCLSAMLCILTDNDGGAKAKEATDGE